MKLSEFKKQLSLSSEIRFQLPNGQFVPKHFHVTEVGVITKDYIDCGGTVRHEKVVNFQLWEANDFDHQLLPSKLLSIIELSENALGLGNWDIEVEYQQESISKYGLKFENNSFLLTKKYTNCLAEDSCGIPAEKIKVKLSDLQSNTGCCTPNSGCC